MSNYETDKEKIAIVLTLILSISMIPTMDVSAAKK